VKVDRPCVIVACRLGRVIFRFAFFSFGITNVQGEVAEERIVEEREHGGAKGKVEGGRKG
jgi:hypothetical protein